jgi:putative FmdB family regulatory protein
MPVYEYVCKHCAHPFEELVFGGERPGCPRCGSRELDKQFSVFGTQGAAALSDSVPGPGSCGSCGDPRGPGACSLN